MVNAG